MVDIILIPTNPKIRQKLVEYAYQSGLKADEVLIDDHLRIPPSHWQVARDLNANRVPPNYPGGVDQWLRDEMQKTVEQMSEAAKRGGKDSGKDVSFVVSMNGWMDYASKAGLSVEGLIKTKHVDIIDVQTYADTPENFALGLNRIRKDILTDPDWYAKLDAITISIAGRSQGKSSQKMRRRHYY
jgi:hypothetical protein